MNFPVWTMMMILIALQTHQSPVSCSVLYIHIKRIFLIEFSLKSAVISDGTQSVEKVQCNAGLFQCNVIKYRRMELRENAKRKQGRARADGNGVYRGNGTEGTYSEENRLGNRFYTHI
jgi:hypothetical protein